MKVYIILESFTDYKGGNATSLGVFKTKEKAIAEMPQVIIKRLGYYTKEEMEEDYGEGAFDKCFINKDRDYWVMDRDDSLIEFYIQADELED